MAIFVYKVARSDGTTLNGQMEGEDEGLIRARLEGQGLLIFKLQRRGAAADHSKKLIRNWSKLPLQEFLVFNQELLALVKAGLPILKIWDVLIDRAQHVGFQNALRLVRQDIRGGASASEALSRHPQHFPELYIATIKAGEQSGNLPEVLQRYLAYLKLMIELRQKVIKALAYPGFLVVVGVAVVGFLLTYVMPTFVAVYGESAKTLPPATKALIDLVQAAQTFVIPVSVLLMVFFLACRAWYGTPSGRASVDQFLLRVPVIGPVLIKHHTIQLTRTLATVLAAGTPLVDALQISGGAISNRFVSSGLVKAVVQIREGTTLAAALDRPKILPALAIEMLSVGEETGSLETMLRDIANFYEGDLDLRLSQLTTWIEPVLLLVMGALVGAIVIIMYLPVFQMAGNV
ncbi:MAG: type II secretion system F family protein [Nitrospiraceae bacterium]